MYTVTLHVFKKRSYIACYCQ